MNDFSLHPQLSADTFTIASMPVCEHLLMNDSRFAWLILVPRRPGLRELHDVPGNQREALFGEIELASRALQSHCSPYKINVAALGNQVEQLHIHVIARHQQDDAWPNPVWGSGAARPYSEQAARTLIDALAAQLHRSTA